MRYINILLILLFISTIDAEVLKPWSKELNKLSTQEKFIVDQKGTERAFSGKCVDTDSDGTYRCKVCNSPLYRSDDKFKSHCGWPSFDDAIDGAVKKQRDRDGHRVEILCAKCNAHLGHIFEGEGYTAKNRRYCVNSLSLNFEKATKSTYKKAYFAGGCFWGVEYYLEKLDGVKSVVSGFMGGKVANPSYREVVTTDTGHLETVEVIYDPSQISYRELAKVFFEIHDPTQQDGQGPDIGKQYRSAIFVSDTKERKVINELISLLAKKGYSVATKILDKEDFYSAEEYHQDYYKRHDKKPYCHMRVKRF